jgi:hypothetical protein
MYTQVLVSRRPVPGVSNRGSGTKAKAQLGGGGVGERVCRWKRGAVGVCEEQRGVAKKDARRGRKSKAEKKEEDLRPENTAKGDIS